MRHNGTHIGTHYGTQLLHYNLPNLPSHKLHLRKGKFYVCVVAPEHIKHFFADGRYRLSTGTNDKRVAEERAYQIVLRIADVFAKKELELDPFIEEVRPFLQRACVNANDWYEHGKLQIKMLGRETNAFKLAGVTEIETSKSVKNLSVEPRVLTNKLDILMALSDKGFHLPETIMRNLNDEECSKIEGGFGIPSVKRLRKHIIEDEASGADVSVAELILANYDNIKGDKRIKFATKCASVVKFSELIEKYLGEHENDGKELLQRKLACEKVISVCGDLPISAFEPLHAHDVAKQMSSEGYANATIRRYITYANGLFRCAVKNRDKFGQPYLKRLPWLDLDLSNYGKKCQKYVPLDLTELNALFALPMPDQDRLLLAMLVTSGMRLDEAALLTWERVVLHQGVLCFDLSDDAKVKNESSKRKIPVPAILQPMLGSRASGRLFDYNVNKFGKAENAASKALMRHIRKVTRHKRKAVHSLRGNFKDLLRENGITKETNDYITGHAQKGRASPNIIHSTF